MTNYFIIGADGREYGPASLEDLRRWVGERRANARSKVRREGEGAWITLQEVPELADVLASVGGSAAPQPLTPPPAPGAGEELADTVFRREPTLNIGDCFARGWDLLVGHPGLLIGATALVALLMFGVGSIPVVGVATLLAFVFVLLGGLYLLFLKYLRDEAVDIGVVFAGFNGSVFVALLLSGVIASALSCVGLLLCIAPGVYLIVCWAMYAPLLIVDKGLDFWQALECSRRVVTRYWWPHFGLFLLALLVVVAGILACGLGVILTLPLAVAAIVVAYEETFGREPEESPAPGLLPEPSVPGPGSEASAPAVNAPGGVGDMAEGAKETLEETPTASPGAAVATEPTGTQSSQAPGTPRSKAKRVVIRGVPPRTAGKAKGVRKATAAARRPRRSKQSPEE